MRLPAPVWMKGSMVRDAIDHLYSGGRKLDPLCGDAEAYRPHGCAGMRVETLDRRGGEAGWKKEPLSYSTPKAYTAP